MPDWSKVGRKSSLKGKTFERAIAGKLSALTGKRWRRTICSGGQYEPDDVKCLEGGWPPIECKNRVDLTLEKVFRNPGLLRGIVREGLVVIFNSGGLHLCVVPTDVSPSCDITGPVATFELDGVAYWLFSIEHFAEVVYAKT